LGDKIISVRLLEARPSGVSLVARGENSPLPEAVTRVGAILKSPVSILTMDVARATLKS